MSEEGFNFREIHRIEVKMEEYGRAGLEPRERDRWDSFHKNFSKLKLSPLSKPLTEVGHPESREGLRMFKALTPEEQKRYGDWTLRQLYAMKLLIDDLDEREPGPL